jgi:hypothetical protein
MVGIVDEKAAQAVHSEIDAASGFEKESPMATDHAITLIVVG